MATPLLPPKLDVTVTKPSPYTFDLGILLALDPNPVDLPGPSSTDDNPTATREAALASLARDGAQSLINQLLLTCEIRSASDDPSSTSARTELILPRRHTPLPREKPLPTPKPPTKWELFAAKRGIKPKTREQRRNLAFDEATGEWKAKWGSKDALNKRKDGKPGTGEGDWLVEVDATKEAKLKAGETVRGEVRRERKERIRRQERRERRNEKRQPNSSGRAAFGGRRK